MGLGILPPPGVAPPKAALVQDFTSSGTWTMPAGAKLVWVEVISGGRAASSTSYGSSGGAYAALFFAADELPATATVTVGAGGAYPSGAGGESSFIATDSNPYAKVRVTASNGGVQDDTGSLAAAGGAAGNSPGKAGGDSLFGGGGGGANGAAGGHGGLVAKSGLGLLAAGDGGAGGQAGQAPGGAGGSGESGAPGAVRITTYF